MTVGEVDEIFHKIISEAVPRHNGVLHELLEGPQYLHRLLDVRVAHQLTGLHCFHQAHHSVKLEKLKSKCAVF